MRLSAKALIRRFASPSPRGRRDVASPLPLGEGGRRSPSDEGAALNPSKPAARQHAPLAADDNRFKLARMVGEDGGGGRPCAVGDDCRKIKARGLSEFERMQAAVCAANRFDQRRRAACKRDALAKRREVDGAALRMQIELALAFRLGHTLWRSVRGWICLERVDIGSNPGSPSPRRSPQSPSRDGLSSERPMGRGGAVARFAPSPSGRRWPDRSSGRTPVLSDGLWAPDEGQRAQTHPASGSAR
jgi:hypothetical protein